jgi:hypothetical protein
VRPSIVRASNESQDHDHARWAENFEREVVG